MPGRTISLSHFFLTSYRHEFNITVEPNLSSDSGAVIQKREKLGSSPFFPHGESFINRSVTMNGPSGSIV